MNSPLHQKLKRAVTKTELMALNIERALSFISPQDRGIWIRCGMGVKVELGDAGFVIWNRWSAQADNYVEWDAMTAWRSFKTSGSLTVATLFHIARLNGDRCGPDNKPMLPSKEVSRREKPNTLRTVNF